MVRDAHARHWHHRTRTVHALLLLGRWCEPLGPALLATAALGTTLILLARSGALPAPIATFAALGALPLGALAATILASRRGWPSRGEARIRLEEAAGLHSRLSAAAEGTATWPEPLSSTPATLRWRWGRVGTLPTLAAALLAAALLIPVSPLTPLTAAPEVPPALAGLDALAEQLDESGLADDPAVQELRAAVDDLLSRPPEAWYEHGALEAADALATQVDSGLIGLAAGYAAAAQALSGLSEMPAGAGSADLASQLASALDHLSTTSLPASATHLAELRSALGNLSPEQLAALAARAEEFAKLSGGLCQGSSGFGEGELAAALAAATEACIGSGSVDRGPGEAPLTLAETGTDATTGADGAVSSTDLSRAALGDSLGRESLRPQQTSDREGPGSAGKVAIGSASAEAVWIQGLTPAERATLTRHLGP